MSGNAHGGQVTWKVVASASIIVLWSILYDLGKDVQKDIAKIKDNTNMQAIVSEVTKQRVDTNTESLQSLIAEHKTLTQDIYTIKDQIAYWRQDRSWKNRKDGALRTD